jgi:hypothetical protein
MIRPEPAYDDKGRMIRPAFLDRDGHLTIFRDHIGRQRHVERNGFVLADGVWSADGLPDCRDVIVRDGTHNFWSVVPDAEAVALRGRIYPAEDPCPIPLR